MFIIIILKISFSMTPGILELQQERSTHNAITLHSSLQAMMSRVTGFSKGTVELGRALLACCPTGTQTASFPWRIDMLPRNSCKLHGSPTEVSPTFLSFNVHEKSNQKFLGLCDCKSSFSGTKSSKIMC